jgi:hypothetical protein
MSVGINGVAATRTDDPLLGEASVKTSLGLLAARTAQAAQRLVAGSELDESERLTLEQASALLGEVLGALDFVASDGHTGSAAAVSFTEVESMVTLAERSTPRADVGDYIRSLVQAIKKARDGDIAEASSVASFFGMLADHAAAEAGSVGDQTL